MPECQKIKEGGLGQYDAECFGRFIFVTIIKTGTERVNKALYLGHGCYQCYGVMTTALPVTSMPTRCLQASN